MFQAKLTKPNKLGDPLRHEWVSCLLLQALVTQASADTAQDANWLQCLETWQWDEQGLQAALMVFKRLVVSSLFYFQINFKVL